MISVVAPSRILPILALLMLALFVGLLMVIEPGPAGAQDQYADQYQQPSSSSTVPDYTPDPPVGCYSYSYDPAGQICVNGTEPQIGAGWDTLNGYTLYHADIYTLGASDGRLANSYIWSFWAYTPSRGWWLTD